MVTTTQEQKILDAANALRTMLKQYQKAVGVEGAQSLGDKLTGLAGDIEDVLVGIDLN